MRKMVWLSVVLLSGCVLKQYPQMPEVSDAEVHAYDCPMLRAQIVQAHNVQRQIAATGKFDTLTVLGFFGDLGTGNGIAKANATRRVNTRLQQLEALQTVRCAPDIALASRSSGY
ncbi:hypothetical protein HA48_01045 [Pantoea wallisii]|uniref:Lipoprotein n=1 Tax=Pantoea wallisii TaxID=1076551 RepID=A0A1X1DED5_9GAMM|nr:hypothetical protein [Pantoea wallisii]ORM75073.1 hypothetical protein HA48_01045 [Pantoea wallisii]